MSEEITLDGVGVAPGVLETIAMAAAEGVEGVAGIIGATGGLAGLVQKGSSRGVCVEVKEGDTLVATVRISAVYGRSLREIAGDVQRAVTDALLTHTGQAVAAVDVYVDGVVFPEQ
ncbi:MAG: Asp23/Gls24 family envelope stress response protein [Coriobacteriia bacterium]|nr:Asp23/Gls24 family envelope stress response protein [Coriobacteriia bacterium]